MSPLRRKVLFDQNIQAILILNIGEIDLIVNEHVNGDTSIQKMILIY